MYCRTNDRYVLSFLSVSCSFPKTLPAQIVSGVVEDKSIKLPLLSYPDHAVSLFEAEQQVSIFGESATNPEQPGKAGCVAQLFGRDVALTATSGASRSDRKTHNIGVS